jgi:hypothetical protein
MMQLIGFGNPIADQWPLHIRITIFPPMPEASQKIR